MSSPFQNNEEIFEFGRQLRDALATGGMTEEANDVTHVVDGYWSSDSEALGAMLDAFESVRPCVANALPTSTVERLDLAIRQITEAFRQANNPNE